MAGQAPAHFKGRCAGRIGHLIDMTMTGDALESMREMPLVCEVDEVGEALQPDPGHRRLSLPMIEQGHGLLGLGGKIMMAPHTELHGRDTGCGGLSCRAVAVEAIYFQPPRVQFMTEAHRLCVGPDQVGAPLRIEQSDRGSQDSGHHKKGRRHPSGLRHDASEEEVCCSQSRRDGVVQNARLLWRWRLSPVCFSSEEKLVKAHHRARDT